MSPAQQVVSAAKVDLGSLRGQTVAITGAGGYVGEILCRQLAEHGCDVIGIDLRYSKDRLERVRAAASSEQIPASWGVVTLVECDICGQDKQEEEEAIDQEILHACLSRADHVVHMASFGMSGAGQLDHARVELVNVGGTKNVLEMCQEIPKIKSLLYVSSYNAVFAGNTIIAGRAADVPYVPIEHHTDSYSRTKCVAEKMVLAANKSGGRGRQLLHTCAVRPAAIYGEGEQRHFPRIVGMVNKGLGFFAIGDANILCDWVHGENVAHGCVVACAGMNSTAQRRRIAGRAFFLSDGHPVNNFTFIGSVLGDPSLFWFRVPTWFMYVIARAAEALHALIPAIVPFLTVAEVCKVGYTHYADPDEARADLGFVPLVPYGEGLQRARAHFAPTVRRPSRLTVTVIMALVVLIVSVVVLAIGGYSSSSS